MNRNSHEFGAARLDGPSRMPRHHSAVGQFRLGVLFLMIAVVAGFFAASPVIADDTPADGSQPEQSNELPKKTLPLQSESKPAPSESKPPEKKPEPEANGDTETSGDGAKTAARDAAAADTVYAVMPADVVRLRVLNWVASQQVESRELLEQIGKMWAIGDDALGGTDLLERAVDTFALVRADVRELIDAAALDRDVLVVPRLDAVLKDTDDTFFAANLRLYYGRMLTQRRMFDEGLEVLNGVAAADVIDPPTLFFCRAVAQHALLMKDEGLASINALLTQTERVPERYKTLATLMQYDLKGLRDGTLDAAARKMNDVERRLALGRGGERVQKTEDEIVEILDEIIKKLEQQQGGGGGGGGNQNSGNQSSNPANDSSVKGSTAPGETDSKDLGNRAGWGDLPPKEQAKAKNLINRNFPAHYREAIEEYFRKLAGRRSIRRPE